jgi:hypothetical protein
MYAKENGNKVTIQCNAPSMSNLIQFWTEVQDYMDKGYRYEKELLTSIREVPAAMTFTRVTLINNTKEETPVVETKEETPVVETKEETPVVSKKAPKKATVKKPAAKK